MDEVIVRYPDADQPFNRTYESLEVFGRFALVYGLIPHNMNRGGRFHAYLVVNTVRNTVDYYSISEAQALASMMEMDSLWDAVQERMFTYQQLDEEDVEDAEVVDGDAVDSPVPPGTKLQ